MSKDKDDIDTLSKNENTTPKKKVFDVEEMLEMSIEQTITKPDNKNYLSNQNNFITPTKKKRQVKDKEDISDEEYDLLSYDKTSSDEDILGESFNIPYMNQDDERKFIAGNKIHIELAAYENFYRKEFYKIDRGTPKDNKETFVNYYKKIEEDILSNQKSIKKTKIEFKKSKNREELTKSKDIQNLKESEGYSSEKKAIIQTLKESIDRPKISLVKTTEETQTNKVYPNFGLAKLSYINKDEKLISTFLKNDQTSRTGHSEVQIFKIAQEIIDKNKDIKNATLIILDIHTALSMCDYNKYNKNNHCHYKAKEFLEFQDNVKVRVSYNFPYPPSWKSVKKGDNDNLFQKQIEIPSDKHSNKKLSPEFVFISSGYSSSPQHKKSIEQTNKTLTPKKPDKKSELIKDDDIAKEPTYDSNSSNSTISLLRKESIKKIDIKLEFTDDNITNLVDDFSKGMDLNKNDDVSPSGESGSDE